MQTTWMMSAILLNPDTFSVHAVLSDPTVNPAAVVPNLKSSSLDGLYQVQVLKAVHLAQDNVADLQVFDVCRGNRAELA
jgi:hypothetical protein